MAKISPAQEVVSDLIDRYSKAGALTLAKKAFAKHPKLWTNLDACRTAVRRALGVAGEKSRREATDKGRFREPRPAGFREIIPDAVDQLGDWEAFDVPGKNSTLILSDVHIPYHSVDSLNLALEYGANRKLTCIILNGDIADHYAISRWQTDPRLRDFPAEVLAVKKFLAGLRKEFPKARIIYKHGNHEERYEVFMKHKCPEFLGLEEFEWGNVFGLKDSGIELVGQKRPITLGKLNVVHGHEYVFNIANPVNPARGLFLRGKVNALCGHFHQSSNHTERTLDQKTISSWSTGCLCDLHPEYRPLNNWSHGFAFVETDKDGAFNVDNLRVIHGKVY